MGRSKGRPQVSGFSGRTIGRMLNSKIQQQPKPQKGKGKR